MCLDLLRRLASGPLPCVLTNRDDVDRAQVLRAAGAVVMLFVQHTGSHQATQRVARVLALTPHGRALLAQAAPAERGLDLV